MELHTERFGTLHVEPHDLVALQSATGEVSSWVLLADAAHPRLYWLQSVSDGTNAIPVCSAEPLTQPQRVMAAASQLPAACKQSRAFLVLHEMCLIQGVWHRDPQGAIVIDPRSRSGCRAQLRNVQTLQHAPSAKVAPLRQSA